MATFGFLVLSLTVFGLATVGGIRTPIGALVGAFIVVYLSEVFRASASVQDWVFTGTGAAIIAVMAYSPDGIAGMFARFKRHSRAVEPPVVETFELAEASGGR